jgi:hypothetical protein
MTEPADAVDVLDHTTLDLDSAERVSYVLDQRFRYTYAEPITSLRQRLVVVPPPRHGNQHRRTHQIEVTGTRARRVCRRDRQGNTVVRLHAERVEQTVEFRATVLVERIRGDGRCYPSRPCAIPGCCVPPVVLRPTTDCGTWRRTSGPATTRWNWPSGSVPPCTRPSATSTASHRCKRQPRRHLPVVAASARTRRT